MGYFDDAGTRDLRALGCLAGVMDRREVLVQSYREEGRRGGRAFFSRSLLRRLGPSVCVSTEPLLRANAALQFGRTMNWILVGATAAGLLFTWWARFHLGALWSDLVVMKAGHQVVDTGPYGLVRHPIYSGLIFAVLATSLQKGTGFALLGVAVVTLAFSAKARREERFLRKELGEGAYDAYARKTPMLVPFVQL